VAAFYLDNDVGPALAALLRPHGHTVETTAARRMRTDDDAEQLIEAWRNGQTLITHNLNDFVALHLGWRRYPAAWQVPAPSHPGILVLEQLPPVDTAPAIGRLLATNVPLADELYRWRRSVGWRRWVLGARWQPVPVP
jgi:uncharacterized protein DUF5615